MGKLATNNETNTTRYEELLEAHSNSLIIYTILIILATTFTLLQSFIMFYFTTKASINLHKKTFSAIVGATMNFFDDHLSGNILNRFSKDIGLIDEFLPFVIFEVIRVSSDTNSISEENCNFVFR